MPMAGMPEMEDKFVVMLMRLQNVDAPQCQAFLARLEHSVKELGGKIQLRSARPSEWDIYDGRDNFVAPDHLHPAVFDFNAMVVAAFAGIEETHAWWNSDQVFNTLKNREGVEKFGAYVMDGLRASFDIAYSRESGDRFLFFEIMSMQDFKPTQHYLDLYKRFAEKAIIEIGFDCNLLFAEGVSRILVSEFPVDAVCASAWRLKTDVKFWYESASYQEQLLPWRQTACRSFAALIPVQDPQGR